MKNKVVWGILLTLVMGLAACGGGDGDGSDDAGSSPAGVTLNEDYADALPVSSQLSIGTFLLEETDDAVTVEQAGELLTAWQMLQALQSSGTAAQVELDAVLGQIQRAMTNEQLTAIKEMMLTSDSLMELIQERGGLGSGFAGGQGGGSFRPPAGMIPGGGAGGQGGGFGAGGNLNPGEQEAALAERMKGSAGMVMTRMFISLLEARAEGETWEVAAPNQGIRLQGVLFGAVVEATGLDQQALREQTREGKTLLEIAEANGADVDEIVAQVVAAETERINQAVADGAMEQAEADQSLAGLEARVREMLEGAFQLGGGRAAPGGGAGGP